MCVCVFPAGLAWLVVKHVFILVNLTLLNYAQCFCSKGTEEWQSSVCVRVCVCVRLLFENLIFDHQENNKNKAIAVTNLVLILCALWAIRLLMKHLLFNYQQSEKKF